MAKRFFEEAHIVKKARFYVLWLDDFALKTPAQQLVQLPNAALAQLLVDEWQAVEDEIDTMKMPFNRLVNTALDSVPDNIDGLADEFVAYINNDLTCYRAAHPDKLIERQEKLWEPWLTWCCRRYDVSFNLAQGVHLVEQPIETLSRLRDVYIGDPTNILRLGGLSHATALLGSAVLALAIEQKEIDTETAYEAVFLDELFQIDQWGKDKEAQERLDNKKREIDEIIKYFMVLE